MKKYDKSKFFNITQFTNYKLNYWAVPKCGCTAIKAALVKQRIFDETCIDYRYIHHHPHLTYITPSYAEVNGNFNFSVVRSPYRRLLALYKHFALRDTERCLELDPNINLSRVHNLNYFLHYLLDERDLEDCNHHFQPIYRFLCSDNFIIIPKLIYDFDEDLFSLTHLLKAHGCTLERANVSNMEISLSRSQKSLIADRYYTDFNLFNFEE